MTDARERRRQHHDAQKKTDVVGKLKTYRVPIVIVLLAGGLIGYQVAAAAGVVGSAGPECPGHWHAGYAVFADGSQLSFNPNRVPGFGDAGGSPGAGAHLHGDDGTLHMHPGTIRCIALGDVMEKLGVEVSDGGMTIAPVHVQQGTYTSNDTHEVAVYHRPWDGEWRKVSNINKFMDDQIGNGDQVLITFIDRGDETELTAQQTGVKSLAGGSYEPQPAGGWTDDRIMTVIAVSIFALLGIAIWNRMTASLR